LRPSSVESVSEFVPDDGANAAEIHRVVGVERRKTAAAGCRREIDVGSVVV